MKQLLSLALVLFALFFQGCQDNLNVPTPASRNYEQDAIALNEFVDINKMTHGYYVNSNKRSSALSYLKNSAAEELNSVNSLNLETFNRSLSHINRVSDQLLSSRSVDYIVIITKDEIYVSRIKDASPVNLRQKTAGRGYASTVSSLDVTGYKEQCYIDGCNYIETSLDLNPQAYKNTGWAFLVTCELDDDIEKKDVSVLFCGVGYHIAPCFEWLTNNNMNWNFEVISLNEDVPYIADLKFLRR